MTGANAAQIRHALRASARTMTTLDVRTDQLRMAVSPYPIVKRLEVSTHFPHGLSDPRDRAEPGRRRRRRWPHDRGRGGRHAAADGLGHRAAVDPAEDPAGRLARDRPDGRRRGRDSRGRAVPAARAHQPGDDGERSWPRRPGPQRPEPRTSATRPSSARSGRRRPPCSPTRDRPAPCTSTSPTRSGPPRVRDRAAVRARAAVGLERRWGFERRCGQGASGGSASGSGGSSSSTPGG